MLVGIHPDHRRVISEFCRKYLEIMDYNGIQYKIFDFESDYFLEELKEVNFFIYRWGHEHDEMQRAKSILPIIENEAKIKVFPNYQTCWHYDDKIKQNYMLKYYGYPVIKSWIFWDKKEAQKFVKDASYPLVLKLTSGAGSSNVKLIQNKKIAAQHIELLFNNGITADHFYEFPKKVTIKKLKEVARKLKILKQVKQNYWQIHKGYVYFQEYLPNNPYDIRITTIGERAFGFTRDNRPGDFRASGSGRLCYDINRINMQCVKIALDISKKIGFQSMAYDFLIDRKKNFHIGEISYTYQDKAVYECSGYWDMNLNWHEGHFWPQYLQLKDLLEITGLKQPEI